MTAPRRLLLVGGGHAHVEVLRRLAHAPIEGVETLVVSEQDHSVYSGMVPGFVACQYRHDEVRIDVAALARRAGARWLPRRATALDPQARQLTLDDGSQLDYHAASLDVGATVGGLDVPGVREYALPSRPIAALVERIGRAPDGPVAVVGGGAAGSSWPAACASAADGSAASSRPPVSSRPTPRSCRTPGRRCAAPLYSSTLEYTASQYTQAAQSTSDAGLRVDLIEPRVVHAVLHAVAQHRSFRCQAPQ